MENLRSPALAALATLLALTTAACSAEGGTQGAQGAQDAQSGAPGTKGTARPTAKRPGTFKVYDNTTLTNVTLGLPRSNVLYQPPMVTDAARRGTLPDRKAYTAWVRKQVKGEGPVVLDFEGLYLQGDRATVRRRFNVLYATAGWTKQVVGDRQVGFWGLTGNTDMKHYAGLARRLATREDAFFPDAYTYDDDLAKWTRKLTKDAAEARQTRVDIPVLAYVWPQYMDNTPRQYQWLTGDHWRRQLETARGLTAGVVIWSSGRFPTVPAKDQGWVTATKAFAAKG